jgi:DNA-binding response OmpR family regulator
MAKILLVDDDVLVRDSLAFALEDAGHAVVPAGNGDEGLAALQRETFDLVILDILMPEREGIETIREIRKTWKTLPVLAISGGDKTGWSDFLRMASTLGATDTLAKPFTASELVSRVARLLGQPPPAA